MRRVAALVAAVLLLGGLAADRYLYLPRSVLSRAKAASFELGVRYAFAVYPTVMREESPELWELGWKEFAKQTGAVLVGEREAYLGTYIIFYTAGGGTAWFFGQTETKTYAMTNWHVVDIGREEASLRKNDLFDQLFASVGSSAAFPCPNFSNFDEYPSCAMDVEIDFGDFVLDMAVLEFGFGSKTARVITLPLGSYEGTKPGTKTITVGAGVGINDLVGYGETLPVRVPYLPGQGEWEFTVPYNMNTVGGFSGSPVVDARTGQVIGLHKGAFLDPRGSGRAVAILIPMELISRVLATHGYPLSGDISFD